MAIPKKLHYIWLGGGPKSEVIQACMKTWSQVCPDYEIVEWNESNYDLNSNQLIRDAVRAHNWALAADMMRAEILLRHGGIYLDTDVELIRPFDDLLEYSFFVGYEGKYWVNNAVIGSEPGHDILHKVVDIYNVDPTVTKDANLMCVHTYSAVLQYNYGVKPRGKSQVLDGGIVLLSQEYFYSMHWLTRKTKDSDKAYCIHRCSNAWLNDNQRIKMTIMRIVRKVLTRHVMGLFEHMYCNLLYNKCKRKIHKIQAQSQDDKLRVGV
ncbi:MAG: hypothetical protein LBK70_03745 [Clostridiales bacterium]|jgi:mannosyltransferase OCH1-like enzyme|nr:hypothetical protein [Clostridiales bacterium]